MPEPTERDHAIAAARDLVAADDALAAAMAAFHAGEKDSGLVEAGNRHFAARSAVGRWDVLICREYVALRVVMEALVAALDGHESDDWYFLVDVEVDDAKDALVGKFPLASTAPEGQTHA